MMHYHYAPGTDEKFVVTGGGSPLYGLVGFTEAQAIETAFHLNTAFDRGREEVRAALLETLGLAK